MASVELVGGFFKLLATIGLFAEPITPPTQTVDLIIPKNEFYNNSILSDSKELDFNRMMATTSEKIFFELLEIKPIVNIVDKYSMKYVKYDKDIQEIGTEVMIISSEMANDINKIQELEGNWFFKIIKMTSGPTENDNNYCITGTCLKNS